MGMLGEKRGSFPPPAIKESQESLLPFLSCAGSLHRDTDRRGALLPPLPAVLVSGVLKCGDSPQWQHRQALNLVDTIWHNYDTSG